MLFIRFRRAAIVLAASAGMSAAVFAAPKIQFDKETVDFGKVSAGDPISVTFVVRNAGDADLQISAVKPGCGCTKAEARKTMLAPGESTMIDAVFNSTGFSGEVSKGITVNTNDPDRKSLSLSIKGQVVPVATVTPATLNFGDLRTNATAAFTLNVAPTDPWKFAIKKVEALGTHVKVTGFRNDTLSAVSPSWQVFVQVTAGKTLGRVMESIRIQTNAGKNGTLSVMVYGNVVQ